jgi:hypothetical protein
MGLLYGIAAVAALWWLASLFQKSSPTALAQMMRVAGGVVSICLAAFLALRGRIDMAFMAGSLGAWLLGYNRLPTVMQRSKASPSQVSRVRSASIEMELDHESGQMRGEVLAGPHAGRRLDDLPPAELLALWKHCTMQDPDGARLLEAYLDRRLSGWRENAEPHPDAGGPKAGAAAGSGAGPMTEQEAHEILGLAPGANAEAIRHAHRNLMKRVHPDQGGSTYLAARVNQAKEVLLGRHR